MPTADTTGPADTAAPLPPRRVEPAARAYARNEALGSHAPATIMGLHPHASAWTLYGALNGVEDRDSVAKARGRYLEPSVMAWWCAGIGQTATVAETMSLDLHYDGTVTPLRCTPDAWLGDNPVDVKTVNWQHRNEWGEPGTSQVPEHIRIQAIYHIGCARAFGRAATMCHLPVLFGLDAPPTEYVVPWSAAEYMAYMRACAEWWQYHMVKGHRPPVTSSMACARAYDAYNAAQQTAYREVDTDAENVVGELLDLQGRIAKATERVELLRNCLRLLMLDYTHMEHDLWTVTYKRSAGGVRRLRVTYKR